MTAAVMMAAGSGIRHISVQVWRNARIAVRHVPRLSVLFEISAPIYWITTERRYFSTFRPEERTKAGGVRSAAYTPELDVGLPVEQCFFGAAHTLSPRFYQSVAHSGESPARRVVVLRKVAEEDAFQARSDSFFEERACRHIVHVPYFGLYAGFEMGGYRPKRAACQGRS